MQSAMGREEVRDLPGDNIVITSRLEAPHRALSLLHCAVYVGSEQCGAGVLTLCPGGGGGGHPALHCGGGGGGLHCAVYVGGGGHLLGSLILSHPGHLLLTTSEHSAALKPDCTVHTAQCGAHLVISRFVTVINLL